jgi:hypothetical protein
MKFALHASSCLKLDQLILFQLNLQQYNMSFTSKVQLSNPFFAEEHLCVHHVFVAAGAQEHRQEGKVEHVLECGSSMMQHQKPTCLIKLDTLKRYSLRSCKARDRLDLPGWRLHRKPALECH